MWSVYSTENIVNILTAHRVHKSMVVIPMLCGLSIVLRAFLASPMSVSDYLIERSRVVIPILFGLSVDTLSISNVCETMYQNILSKGIE